MEILHNLPRSESSLGANSVTFSKSLSTMIITYYITFKQVKKYEIKIKPNKKMYCNISHRNMSSTVEFMLLFIFIFKKLFNILSKYWPFVAKLLVK